MLKQIFHSTPNPKLPHLTLGVLTNLLDEMTDNKHILAAYLAKFVHKGLKQDYILSGIDLFHFFTAINTVNNREQLFFINHPSLQSLFEEKLLFELFKTFKKIALLNERNFKLLYSLTDDDKKMLLDLLTEHGNTISEQQIKLLLSFAHETKPLLKSLFDLLSSRLTLLASDVLALFSLSHTNIERLYDASNALIKTKLLTNDSYRFAFQRITTKQPEVNISSVTKLSGKINNKRITLSSLTIHSSFNLYIDSQRSTNEGGMGKIKRAYRPRSQKRELSTYAIKKFYDHPEAEKMARRSVRANKLLGREAYYFSQQHKYKMIFPWQPGKSLDQYKSEELIKIPLVLRFDSMINGLLHLEELHKHFYIHGDVKPANFIFDKASQMNLIDFDSTRKKGSHSFGIFTQNCFRDKRLAELKKNPSKQSFFDDVYAMGLTFCKLFPELYKEKYADAEKDKLPIVSAIRELVAAMLQIQDAQRCTMERALDYVQQILAAEEEGCLNAKRMAEIAAQTIYQNEITAEDAIRGRTCLVECSSASS